jgi:DNA-directed RNA polymerase subunit RPC12/RpoP
MASWIISCINCRVAFEHAKINDYSLQDYLLPMRPTIPPEGVEVECPHCGHKAMYKTTDLFYRR